jgi:hypothetical protein
VASDKTLGNYSPPGGGQYETRIGFDPHSIRVYRTPLLATVVVGWMGKNLEVANSYAYTDWNAVKGPRSTRP